MKFGLFYNPQIPKSLESGEWDPGQEIRRFDEMFEQVELADRLGFDYVWLGEHHFTAEYAHNSSPEVILGALSQRTKNIRLGTGIMQMSHNDPIRAAERVGTIDMLSRGRFEFGFGKGQDAEIAPWMEGLIGAAKDRNWAAVQVAVDILGSPMRWEGVDNEFFHLPGRTIVPKPVQQPHPPLWSSSFSPEGVVDAARRGIGSLFLSPMGPSKLGPVVDQYWSTLLNDCHPIAKAVNPAIISFAHVMIARTDEQAVERAGQMIEWSGYGLGGGLELAFHDGDANLNRAFHDYKEGRGDARLSVGVEQRILDQGEYFINSPSHILAGVDRAR